MSERLPTGPSAITDRQLEVARLVADGQTNAEIAQALGISVDGAKYHVSELLTRLGLTRRREITEWYASRPRRRFGGWGWWPWVAGGAGAFTAAVALTVVVLLGRSSEAEPVVELLGLSDGTAVYDYRPQLAYIDGDGDAWLIDAGGGNRVLLIKGCGGVQYGEPRVGGLTWSGDGSRIACAREDGSVLAAVPGAGTFIELAPAAGCAPLRGLQWAPDASHIACAGSTGEAPTIEVHVIAADGRAATTVSSDTAPTRFAWSPSGRYLVYTTPPRSNRVTYRVIDTAGAEVADIEDARVGHPSRFNWTRNDSAVAYAVDEGLAVHDLPQWERRALDTSWMGSVGWSAWVLDDRALLVGAPGGPYLIDATTGNRLPLSLAGSLYAITPDGRHAVLAVRPPGAEAGHVEIVDLTSGAATSLDEFTFDGEGLGPLFTFSGDSSRLCWQSGVGVSRPPPACVAIDGSDVEEIAVPLQFDPVDSVELATRVWASLSPDLTRVAYTLPGPDDPAAPQTLWIANLDGSDAVEVGVATGAFPFAWRPDGVYRPGRRQ